MVLMTHPQQHTRQDGPTARDVEQWCDVMGWNDPDDDTLTPDALALLATLTEQDAADRHRVVQGRGSRRAGLR